MSNRPRAMPDWLVATTTRQPPCVRRAIASMLPGSGFHSAGDLMYLSLSWLIVPSRSRITSFIGYTASLERSATRFMASRRSRSSARRLRRSLSSSTMTMTLSKKASTGAFSTEKLFRYPA